MFITKEMAIAAIVAGCRNQLLQADITQELAIKQQVAKLVPEETVDTVQSFGKVHPTSRENLLVTPLQ